ncbi:hypothetical protein B0J11DRAFT_619639 [Dendryphion nanum]|uniref:Uncharacterized protein n=1 Tax=Dendryphion nanum TaxID=256645 RepID=A0A9P9D4V6_9PLEO|nr:hypothetical protein B0J11DRAFT_619639 [Dendryphion nanum]
MLRTSELDVTRNMTMDHYDWKRRVRTYSAPPELPLLKRLRPHERRDSLVAPRRPSEQPRKQQQPFKEIQPNEETESEAGTLSYDESDSEDDIKLREEVEDALETVNYFLTDVVLYVHSKIYSCIRLQFQILSYLIPILILTLTFLLVRDNLKSFDKYTKTAARPPAFDGIFAPSCEPTFLAATCPEVLGAPPTLYKELLLPARRVPSLYRRTQQCWHPDKAPNHPSPHINSLFLSRLNTTFSQCREAMMSGTGYPRRVKDQGRGHTVNLRNSLQWTSENQIVTEAPLRLHQNIEACKCDMTTATRDLFYGLITPPWSDHYFRTPPDPVQRVRKADYCPCDIKRAWRAYDDIFDIEFHHPWPITLFSKEWQLALGWLSLRAAFPSLDFLTSRTKISFRAKNLPLRGAHPFWLDDSEDGLPEDSMREIGVPDFLTAALKCWGRDGMRDIWDLERNMTRMSEEEQNRCIASGWCFPHYFGRGEDPDELNWGSG